MKRTLLGLTLFAALPACLDDWKLEEQTFACDKPSDCVAGYYCDPDRLVCTKIQDGGMTDAGGDAGADAGPDDPRPGLGEACDPSVGCRVGPCVDGYCCESPCDGLCERCDAPPGTCSPVSNGEDPDLECSDLQLECVRYTCGLDPQLGCRACLPGVSAGVCNGDRQCRPEVCPEGLGDLLVQCANFQCTKDDACPAGRLVDDYNEIAELCDEGRLCNAADFQGCCSPEGTCCPAPACNAFDPTCE